MLYVYWDLNYQHRYLLILQLLASFDTKKKKLLLRKHLKFTGVQVLPLHFITGGPVR